VVAAIISNIAVHYKQRSTLDDTLDVFPCHGIGGIVGMLMTGLFATKAINSAGTDGLFYGNASFLFTQIKAIGIVVAYSFVVSFVIFKFINFILPLRVSSEDEVLGLDSTQHNEKYMQGTLLVPNNGQLEEHMVD
jgi:Amt family ammonium transporter